MNGQRYQKKEEESVVPSTNAVIHLVPKLRNGTTKRETNDKLFDHSKNTQSDIRNKLIKELKN